MKLFEIILWNIFYTNFSSKYYLYHLNDKSNLTILNPSIPKNYLSMNNFENNNIPRVSFSLSIYGALRGLSQNLDNKVLYVYVPIGDYKVITPNKKQVPDVMFTQERWIPHPVNVKMIGKIQVISAQKNHPIGYKYNKDKIGFLYGWNYKWLQKYS